MYRSNKRILFFLILLALLIACMSVQPTPDVKQIQNQVATAVVLTITALPRTAPATSTLPPTPTEVVFPTSTLIPTMMYPVITPTAKPAYQCDIIDQRPYDDTVFHPGESFDIKWTIVNTGTQKWEHETYLEYDSGPAMTDTTSIELPRLKPGEQHEIILDAAAPTDRDRQIMVWVVRGPGKEDNSMYWMCYPYIRIVVDK